jgi:hypothetical protein
MCCCAACAVTSVAGLPEGWLLTPVEGDGEQTGDTDGAISGIEHVLGEPGRVTVARSVRRKSPAARM